MDKTFLFDFEYIWVSHYQTMQKCLHSNKNVNNFITYTKNLGLYIPYRHSSKIKANI